MEDGLTGGDRGTVLALGREPPPASGDARDVAVLAKPRRCRDWIELSAPVRYKAERETAPVRATGSAGSSS